MLATLLCLLQQTSPAVQTACDEPCGASTCGALKSTTSCAALEQIGCACQACCSNPPPAAARQPPAAPAPGPAGPAVAPAAPAVAPTTAATTAPATWQKNPYLTAQHLNPLQQQQQQQQLAKQQARVGLANQGQLPPSSTVSTMAAGGPIPNLTQSVRLFRPVPAAPPHPPGKAPGPPPSPFSPPPPPPAPSPATPAPAPAPPPPPPQQNFVQAPR